MGGRRKSCKKQRKQQQSKRWWSRVQTQFGPSDWAAEQEQWRKEGAPMCGACVEFGHVREDCPYGDPQYEEAWNQVCGRRKVGASRIMGGSDAQKGACPWQVSIMNNVFHICGGSLIDKNWVLSAAHCFQGFINVKPFTVRLGALSLSQQQGVDMRLLRIVLRPGFKSADQGGDAALLELEQPAPLSETIFPVCLPSPSTTFTAGQECWVTGWGNIKEGVPLSSPHTLQQLVVPLVDSVSCDTMYHIGNSFGKSVPLILPDVICAGYQEGRKDSCQGDSGGPLVCPSPDCSWILAGIVSWGDGCAQPNRPGCTRVSLPSCPGYERPSGCLSKPLPAEKRIQSKN
ncbi:serine protease 33-like [Acipenser ruthenus]|uniref:serine protease 33-like n=1 Tax=Acipenser ruthenus TaxID=7906 RepID=UPI0027415DFB|nr:serine protease 33-like [Acipenser ruthenus]